MKPNCFDAIIVGGGIVGVTTALELIALGHSVALVDPADVKRRSSYGNGGVISRGSIFPVAGPLVRKNLLKFALGMSPEVRIRYGALVRRSSWLKTFLSKCNEAGWHAAAGPLNDLQARAFETHSTLGKSVGTSHLLRRPGWIKLFRNQAAFDSSALERRILASKGIKTQILDSNGLRELEPFLKPRFTHGLWFPETGTVNGPDILVEACHRAFLSRGGVFVEGTAQAVQEGEVAVTVSVNGMRLDGSHVVIAAGAWSAALAAQLGYKIPFAAERGYHRHYENPAGGRLNRPVLDTGGSFAMVPVKDSLRLLSAVEIAGPDDPPDYAQLNGIVEDARASFSFQGPIEGTSWVGSRPSTPDGLPVVGRAPNHRRIFFAFGHGHIGFSTGPVTATAVALLIAGRSLPFSLAPFSAERFL